MGRLLTLLTTCLFACGGVQAQKIPEPARAVFKCTVKGKVVYTDDPCPGAERVDIQPTRGLNKSTGKELLGADVKRERHNEAMADAMRPIFNESASQRETRHRRAKLVSAAQAECASLDRLLVHEEASEQRASPPERAESQASILRLRKRHRELRC